jgi:hypothetical protein
MTTSNKENPLIRNLIAFGGLANIAGGVFVAVAYLLHPPAPLPAVVASGLWLVVHVGFMISLNTNIASHAISRMPTKSDPVPNLQMIHILTRCRYGSDHFVPWYERVLCNSPFIVQHA